MVNAPVVNGAAGYFLPADFCESFYVFGQIPRFKNPFKYTHSFDVNHYAVHSARVCGSRQSPFFPSSQ
jgi:hypothetical protein